MPAYLTFDIGTSALKTALIGDDGRPLAVHTEEYTFRSPRPEWAEMPPQTYWSAAVTGTRAVFAASGADPAQLAAIGFSSQGQTFVPIDDSGRELHDTIVWVDNRAQAIADAWEAEWLSRDDYRRITGYPWLAAGLTAFKIAWMREHAPNAHRARRFLCLPDYLIYRMTGVAVTDCVTAQGTGLFNVAKRRWEPKLMDAAGIGANQMPEVVEPGTVAGTLNQASAAELGVPAGVTVCVGANDQLVGAVGAGNVRHGIVTETTGTALALVATSAEPIDDHRMFVGRHVVPGHYYAMPFAITSAIVLKWFRDMCAEGEDYDAFLAEVDAIEPGCGGLTMLPHFAGTGAPTFNPRARGAFAGLTLGHTRAHMARAIMEACACMLQECLDPVVDHGIRVEGVRSLGGAARSDVWLQMKADLLGVSVERPACSDAASLGAAMLAAVGVGRFASVREASEEWYRPARVFEPDPARFAAYREAYARYLDLYQRLHGDSGA